MAGIAPGSRSTPMALALAARPEIRIELFHDERSAAFAALGAGIATGVPAVLLCTSGTAAAHFYAAIIEADLSGVPMIVVTADRPPELVDVGAPQTIDQTKMYGNAVRWFHAPGVPDDVSIASWRSLGARAAAEAMGFAGRPGVAHLNLAFREPLIGVAGSLPAGRNHNAPWHSVVRAHTSSHPSLTAALQEAWHGRNGVLIAGRGSGNPEVVLELGELLGWPVFAEHRSGCAVPQRSVRYFDAVLRHDGFVAAHRPDVIVRIGELPASKVTSQWIGASGATIHAVVPAGKWIDPDHSAGALIVDSTILVDMCTALRDLPRPTRRFSDDWERADVAAGLAIVASMDALPSLSDPAIARAVVQAVPSNGALVVSSSMPVRDVEWFGEARNDISVFSNRGANGIDGVIATAIGVACATNKPTICLIGDVAFLHDSSSLSALINRRIDLTIVVPNNDGGAIFSFLPQATAMDNDRYEQLFGTPHGTDLVALSAAHGLAAEIVTSSSQISYAPGIRVLVAETQRTPNVAIHQQLNAAVCAALDTLVL
jgi:2-succinyl-5-enolpyruvyl-6-hydroxy-3-cyclohexene-1-carboxylate synthase